MTKRQEFRVLQTYEDFELREYLPCVIAEVKVSANPRVDIPEFVDFWREGKLPVEKLLTSVSPMAQVNEAMDALQGAQVVRQVIHPH